MCERCIWPDKATHLLINYFFISVYCCASSSLFRLPLDDSNCRLSGASGIWFLHVKGSDSFSFKDYLVSQIMFVYNLGAGPEGSGRKTPENRPDGQVVAAHNENWSQVKLF
jgi:hypothetical protein